MPATIRNATVQMVAKPANQSREVQFGSMTFMAVLSFVCAANEGKTYSAGAMKPADGMPGFGVREVLRMLVLTKRVS
jgi:hypothetical protein